jgi:CRISPR-associated protein Csa2
MVYVGVAARFLVNVEALNMAESIGNVVRHKKAPVVVRTKSGYVLRYAPVVSGQSIAHGYQELLAGVAKRMGLPVCPLCEQGIFVKHGADQIIRRLAEQYKASYAARLLELAKNAKKNPPVVEEFERTVIENCVVEDVGGFLYPGAVPVKRTSRFQSGYMIPSIKYIAASGVEAQMHVRHDPLAVTGRAGEETGQAIYYVEMGSALYTVNLGLDLDMIGCYPRYTGGWAELGDAGKRREAALRALAMLVEGMLWGAKKSRFLPSVEPESIAVVIAHPFPFNPHPGHDDDYIDLTVKRAEGYLRAAKGVDTNAFIEVHYFISSHGEGGVNVAKPSASESVRVAKASTPSEAVLAALKHIEKAGCAGGE